MKTGNFASVLILSFLWFWQLLQIIVGSVIAKIEGSKHEFVVLGVRFVYSVGFVGYRSFGPIAIIDARQYRSQGVLNRRTSKLVLAYAKISKILGPLFLLFLVISSFKFRGRCMGFAEKWAESIAGLD